MRDEARERIWVGRVFIGASLDGFIARPDGDIEWLVDPPSREHAVIHSGPRAESWETFFPAVDHVVMGRGTYEKVLSFDEWPYGGKTVVVLSTMLDTSDERVVVVRSLDEARRVLDANGARQVYVDGGRVIQAFLREGLVDEMTVSHAPVLLGGGLPLFGSLAREVLLVLTGSHATPDGMVHCTYAVQRAQQDG